jgi:hypothetical protein
MLLYSYVKSSDAERNQMCEGMLRGEVTSSTSIRFTRGDGAAGCGDITIDEISWERITFTDPNIRVQQIQPSMAAGVGSANVAIASIDLTKTIVLAGGQWVGGQAVGEGSYAGNDVLGAMVARHRLTSSTNVEVIRDNTSGSARWTSFVVEFASASVQAGDLTFAAADTTRTASLTPGVNVALSGVDTTRSIAVSGGTNLRGGRSAYAGDDVVAGWKPSMQHAEARSG